MGWYESTFCFFFNNWKQFKRREKKKGAHKFILWSTLFGYVVNGSSMRKLIKHEGFIALVRCTTYQIPGGLCSFNGLRRIKNYAASFSAHLLSSCHTGFTRHCKALISIGWRKYVFFKRTIWVQKLHVLLQLSMILSKHKLKS